MKITDEEISKLQIINVGIVGHIDHGKTTLLYKLSGKWTDTHSEELKRGITIKLGYADAVIYDNNGIYNIHSGQPKRYITFVDAPGHEMLMATMLSGAAMIDAAILVISAKDGIQPQTREHLTALEAKKIKNIIIAQNKIDLVTKEEAKRNYEKIKELVRGTIAENSPIIPCSAQQEINIDKILKEICEIKIPERNTTDNPVFIIARSFDINRPGAPLSSLRGGVLGGALKSGQLKIGDEIEIKPGITAKKENQIIYETLTAKIIGLQRGNNSISEATPGGSLAIETSLDPILTKADILSGCVAGLKNNLPEITNKAKISFKLFENVIGTEETKKVENIKPSELLLLSINTTITIGTAIKIKGNEVEIALRIPIVNFKGENVGIARN
ncbi:MAG: translation initiation factor IF-2 subunit gamma [Nanoarchaeota archaeon]|mgnify:CR=1 FL=1